MPKIREIEAQLGDVYNWLLVSYKKNILKGLEKVLNDEEVIVDLLDGLMSGRGKPSGIGASGVLCITDRRLLFVESEKPGARPEIIRYEKITDVRYGKSFSSTTLSIEYGGKEISFKSFANETAVRKFADKFRQMTGNGTRFREEDKKNIIDTMTQLFVDRISSTDMKKNVQDVKKNRWN